MAEASMEAVDKFNNMKEFERILAVGQANPQLRQTAKYREVFRAARGSVLRGLVPAERYKGVLRLEDVEAMREADMERARELCEVMG